MKNKLLYIFVLIAITAFLLTTCSTTKKILIENDTLVEKEKVKVISAEVVTKDTLKINYIPDSISEITINLVGDLMCHLPQTKNAQLSNGIYDFKPSFEYIKPYLKNADLTIGNLETTFAGTSQPFAGYPAFNSPDAYCEALKDAGFDFLVTANNHSMDTREAGLL